MTCRGRRICRPGRSSRGDCPSWESHIHCEDTRWMEQTQQRGSEHQHRTAETFGGNGLEPQSWPRRRCWRPGLPPRLGPVRAMARKRRCWPAPVVAASIAERRSVFCMYRPAGAECNARRQGALRSDVSIVAELPDKKHKWVKLQPYLRRISRGVACMSHTPTAILVRTGPVQCGRRTTWTVSAGIVLPPKRPSLGVDQRRVPKPGLESSSASSGPGLPSHSAVKSS